MHHVWTYIDIKQYIFEHMDDELKQKLGDLNYDNYECVIAGIERDSWYVADDLVGFHCVLVQKESSEDAE